MPPHVRPGLGLETINNDPIIVFTVSDPFVQVFVRISECRIEQAARACTRASEVLPEKTSPMDNKKVLYYPCGME